MDACKFDIFNAKAVGAYAILWNAGEYGAHYLLFIICGGRSIELYRKTMRYLMSFMVNGCFLRGSGTEGGPLFTFLLKGNKEGGPLSSFLPLEKTFNFYLPPLPVAK